MPSGVKTIVYPVTDLAQAKKLYGTLIGAAPSSDSPYYVGFTLGDQEIGLDPNGHRDGMTAYWDVDDINESLRQLLDAGAQADQPVKDVGGGMLIATVKDADGNILGIRQLP